MRKAPVILLALLLTAGACARKEKPASRAPFRDVTIGLLYTTAGRGGDLANATLGAASVAAAHLKGDHGVDVKIEQGDYQGDLALAGQAAIDLASKVDAVVVGTDDPAILPAVSGLTVPVLLAYVTADDATTAGGSLFRLAPSDRLQAERLASYLVRSREYSNLALIYENTDYGRSGFSDFSQAVTSAGGTLVASDAFETGGDIHLPVMRAADRGAEALVVWTDNPAEAARVVIEVHRMALSYQLALAGNVAVPQFGKNAVAQVVPTAFREGILSVGPWAGPWLRSDRIRRFYSGFEATQNVLAPVRAAQVYDAVLLASKALASGDIRAGLALVRDFQGASIPINFDSAREGMDLTDLWAWGFTKSKDGAGAEFFEAVDVGGGFFTLVPKGLQLPENLRYLLP